MRKALYILGDLLDRDIIWMSRTGTVRRLAKGEVLIHAGREVRDLFFVTAGRLAVTLPDGARVAELGTGDVIGEMSFVEKRPPSASVAALEPARLLAIPRERMLAEFARDPAMAARFYRALAVFLSDRLRATTAASMGQEADAELDEGLLDTLHVAGDRMIRLIDMLEGRVA